MGHRRPRKIKSWAVMIWLSLVVVLAFRCSAQQQQEVAVSATLDNQSGKEVMIFWINNQDTNDNINEAMVLGSVGVGREFTVNSFVGHKFRLEEQPSPTTGMCADDNICQMQEFELISNEKEQSLVIQENLQVSFGESEFSEDTRRQSKNTASSPKEVIQDCRARVERRLSVTTSTDMMEDTMILRELSECIEIGMQDPLIEIEDEIDFHAAIRESIAEQLENITCIDPGLGSSPDVDERTWTSKTDGRARNVHMKLDKPASRIHVIENFTSVEECQAMQELAGPRLRKASVADGNGGIRFSESRKAWQAPVHPKYDEEGDLVAQLGNRIFEYTNHVLNLNVTHEGQEPLMSIQYFGRGYNDTSPDRYTTHCDGICTGEPHRTGNRMATTVVYCAVPKNGGHTNFQYSGVHIKPVAFSAVFFSYIDPETKMTDLRLTSHSGCPVYEGEKKIITQWVRLGVDKETDWKDFNTLGVLKEDDGE